MRSRDNAMLASILALALTAGCNVAADDDSDAPEPPQAQPGDVALDYVSGETYPSLLVEIDYIAGSAPSNESIAKMREIFTLRLEKPGGVEVLVDTEIPASESKTRYQMGDILALESAHRRNQTGDASNPNQAVIWILYLNGESEFDTGTTRALGLSFAASSVALFRDNVARTTRAEAREVVEAMVLVHEGGHLFGLVNNGLPMVNPHEDMSHPRHDVSSGCIMYHRIETANSELLLTNPPIDFDYNCRLDMFAAGGPDPGPAPLTAVTAEVAPTQPRLLRVQKTPGPIYDAATSSE